MNAQIGGGRATQQRSKRLFDRHRVGQVSALCTSDHPRWLKLGADGAVGRQLEAVARLNSGRPVDDVRLNHQQRAIRVFEVLRMSGATIGTGADDWREISAAESVDEVVPDVET